MPTLRSHPIDWFKYQIARLLQARIPLLDFAYVPSDFCSLNKSQGSQERALTWPDVHISTFALADSPVGLLAFMLHFVGRPTGGGSTTATTIGLANSWSRSDLLTWTMLYWLPGPEAPLRWLQAAEKESSSSGALWRGFSSVPLGVSFFKTDNIAQCPPIWASSYADMCFLRRHNTTFSICWPLWEVPHELVIDLRHFVQDLARGGLIWR